MAFVLPLLSAALEYQSSMNAGHGLRIRRGLQTPSGSKRHTAKGLAVLSKYPMLSRPHAYKHGSGMLAALRKRLAARGKVARPAKVAKSRMAGGLAVLSKYPLLSRPHCYKYGSGMVGMGRKKRRGGGPYGDILGKIPLLGMLLGPITNAIERGVTGHGVRTRGKHGKHSAKGLLSPAGGLHKVKGHVKRVHTSRGVKLVRVKAHKAAPKGYGMVRQAMLKHAVTAPVRRHRVAAHVRHAKHGPVIVKSHLAHDKGGAMLRKGIAMMGPRMVRAMTKGRSSISAARLHPRHYARGLLRPA